MKLPLKLTHCPATLLTANESKGVCAMSGRSSHKGVSIPSVLYRHSCSNTEASGCHHSRNLPLFPSLSFTSGATSDPPVSSSTRSASLTALVSTSSLLFPLTFIVEG